MSSLRLPLIAALVVVAVVSAWASSDTEAVPPPAVLAADAGEAPTLAEAPDAGSAEVPLVVPSRLEDPPFDSLSPLPREQDLLARAKLVDGRYVVRQGDSERALTILPALQSKLTGILQSYQTPYAAIVVMDPNTGRVLAMAEHSELQPGMRGLPVKAVFPAASIFKIVTATALLDSGVKPEDTECSRGGKRRVTLKHLQAQGGDCYSLSEALAHSANAVFAKLTAQHLSKEKLQKWAELFHFNKPLDFAVPTDTSLAAFPEGELALAQTGAGFGDVYLSPLHGAALASVSARGGTWVQPELFEDAEPQEGEQVLSAEQAQLLNDMLEGTVTRGTARRIFRERGFKVAGAVGKTGSLADKKPFRDYSWFVGFAPRDNPKVAVAAVVVNGYYWRIRGTWLGREALRLGLEALPQTPEETRVASDAR